MGNTSRNYALVDDVSTKNYIMNGGMDFFQRAPSTGGFVTLSTTLQYVLDRWTAIRSGTFGATTDIRRSAPLPSNPTVDTSLAMQINTENPSLSGNIVRITQRIESIHVRELAGRTASLSFYMMRPSTNSTAGTVAVSMATPVSADDFSSMNAAFTLPGGASSATFNAGSINTWVLCQLDGISIPSNATNGLEITLEFSTFDTTPAVGTQYLTQVMLNAGIKCAAFKRHGNSLAEELVACQRYFEKSYDVNTFVDTNTPNGMFGSPLGVFSSGFYSGGLMTSLSWKVTKRTAPTVVSTYANFFTTRLAITFWNEIGNDDVWQTFTAASGGTNRTPVVYSASQSGMRVGFSTSSTDIYAQGHWAVDCEL